jgi:hypothetical protein
MESEIKGISMKQPTKEEITQNVRMVLDGKRNREDICSWAINYIRNDEQIIIDDIEAWHYLVEISNIDEMIAAGEYLFAKEDIEDMLKKYS